LPRWAKVFRPYGTLYERGREWPGGFWRKGRAIRSKKMVLFGPAAWGGRFYSTTHRVPAERSLGSSAQGGFARDDDAGRIVTSRALHLFYRARQMVRRAGRSAAHYFLRLFGYRPPCTAILKAVISISRRSSGESAIRRPQLIEQLQRLKKLLSALGSRPRG
jgi:hypothetical protein